MKTKKFKKHKRVYILVLIILLLALVSLSAFLILHNLKNPPCKEYSYFECPSRCVVCPSCEICSSVSCQTEESCEKIGFDRSWYESIKDNLDKLR